MNRYIASCCLVLIGTPISPVNAQVVIDLSQITCGQFLKTDTERQALIGWWMSGYFSATKNLNELDLRYVKRNVKVVTEYCKKNKTYTVMNAMQKNWR
ncbi:HdeA/HdeB family chaperone [Tardiphaga sp. 813_E8_N1_3]|jgi:acid stress chaperone HdeB|uniref:HdeA/HdeB family chaperone n=1 Tax=Tardiphaga sp. 813_E8_N1_3 TaxID=3240760 RepID=UPI003F2704DC